MLEGQVGALIFAFEAGFRLDQIKSGGLVDYRYEKVCNNSTEKSITERDIFIFSINQNAKYVSGRKKMLGPTEEPET